MRWAYGVTTVADRVRATLPRTLESLAKAGFPQPRLFLDGAKDCPGVSALFKTDISSRFPRLGAFGNWWLGLMELYIRNPHADRYLVFQDDVLAYTRLRDYLEHTVQEGVYWNLFTNNMNWLAKPSGKGWFQAPVNGKGALGLLFTNEALQKVLGASPMVCRPKDQEKGQRGIDGVVYHTLTSAGYREMVHEPSLLQHTGTVSTVGSKRHSPAPNFLEDWETL